jgi:hypothetical protein
MARPRLGGRATLVTGAGTGIDRAVIAAEKRATPLRQLATVEDRAAAAPDVAGDATDVTISVDGGLIALAANGSKASNWQLRHPLFAM